ncbi:MAG: hypothetical protein ABI852_14155 [Gemmatimonadaceae bacterium]
MSLRLSKPNSPPPISLHERAADNMAFVRGMMERSSHFTAVPGWGGVAMGTSAIVAAIIASLQSAHESWLAVWSAEAAVASLIALFSIVQKARRSGVPLGTGPARRFALCLLPALAAGAVLTVACVQAEAFSLLPMIWLLLYGVGVCSAAAVSSPTVVLALGLSLIVGGGAAALSPAPWGNWYLAAFFGVGHIVAGAVIIKHHGG